MTSNRPYLLRALHQWIVDNGCTPQILVDTTVVGVDVPRHVIENDQVMLNISYSATGGLELGDEWIMFAARFNGVSRQLAIPVSAVRVMLVRENDWKMVFPPEELPPSDPNDGGGQDRDSETPPAGDRRPQLKVVK